jgi:sensor c-di-GMP phosphodiesterase-like protein
MAKFIRIFVSERHLLFMRVGAWGLMFIVTLGLLGWVGAYQVGETMQAQTRVGIDQLARLRDAVSSALALLKVQATAEPCTPAFRDQLRKVAYLPDGLNEFLYAPGGAAQCSVSVERCSSGLLPRCTITSSRSGTTIVY